VAILDPISPLKQRILTAIWTYFGDLFCKRRRIPT
jgi:hypothetical protein